MKRIIISAMILCHCLIAISQSRAGDFWFEIENEAELLNNQADRYIVPENYLPYELLLSDLIAYLRYCPTGKAYEVENSDFFISFPYPDGSLHTFKILETPVMPRELSSKYPSIKTYTGVDIADAKAYLKMDVTPQGFHASVRTSNSHIYVDPYFRKASNYYISYYKKDLLKKPSDHFECGVDHGFFPKYSNNSGNRAGDCTLRTYRAAIAATGEYTTYHGGSVNALAAIVTSLNRVNSVYEIDLGITMNLVPNNNLIVYSNANTDPYTNNSTSTMLSQNASNLASVIGTSNFDIGHVFGVGGGGVAFLGSVCGSNKARGATTLSPPVGDPFDIDYVAHEIGHQFGANHTQNANCNRVSGAAYEVGSGNTIMGYAGVCSPYNVQPNSDAMFHSNSIREISNFITNGNGNSCPIKSFPPNSKPVINAGSNYIIPKSTPFVLRGSGTDPDNDDISYSWEQWDPEFGAVMPPASTNSTGPLFRTFLPESAERYFPELSAILNNTNPTWEVLPSVGRSMEFRLIGRDNNPGIGCTDEDNMNITVASNSGPFEVSYPNSSSVTWNGNSTQTVTWNVSNTNNFPVNCSNVEVFLSYNGGLTFPDSLGTFLNTGSAVIAVPNKSTTNARLMVKGSNNIFFDVSNQDFSINAVATNPCPTPANLSVSGISATSAILNWDTDLSADSYEIRGNEISSSGFVTLTVPNPNTNSFFVSGLSGNTSYFWQIRSVCNSSGFTSPWSPSNVFTTLNCTAPDSIYTDVVSPTTAILNWTSATNAVNYNIRGGIQGSSFVNLKIAGGVSSYSVFNLIPSTTYVWQIRSNCSSTVRSPYNTLTSFTTLPLTSKTNPDLSDGIFSAYPNPSSGIITLYIDADIDLSEARIFISDNSGRIVKNVVASEISNPLSIDLNNVASGIYFVNLLSKNIRETNKLILID